MMAGDKVKLNSKAQIFPAVNSPLRAARVFESFMRVGSGEPVHFALEVRKCEMDYGAAQQRRPSVN
jgi:hypothetical protein